MNDKENISTDGNGFDVALIGGPGDIPETVRLRSSSITGKTLKIAHLGGYEHFELVEDSLPVVFRWTMRTKIAE